MTERVTGRRWMGSAVVTVLLALGLVVTTLAIALSVAERPDNIFSTGKIWLNGRIVRLDYFGNGTAEALSRELANLLRGESGVAN